MNPEKYFTSYDILLEGRNSFFSNILYLSHEDRDWLKLVGRGMFEGFDNKLLDKIEDLRKSSSLAKSIQKESRYIVEDYKYLFWESSDDLSKQNGTLVCTLTESDKVDYKAPVREETILLYFPVLHNWVRHYTHSPKFIREAVISKEIVKSVSLPLDHFKHTKKILAKIESHELVERVQYK